MKFLILAIALFAFGCGSSSEEDSKSTPTPAVTPEQQKAWDSTVKPIVTANCALSGCHGSEAFVKTPAAFLGSKAKGQVSSGRMPKGRVLTPDQKAAILNL